MNKDFERMNKEVYRKEKQRLMSVIYEARAAQVENTDKYINENKRFEIGDRVRVMSENKRHIGDGIVKGFTVSSRDEVIPILLKIKKDGTAGKHNLTFYHSGETYHKLEDQA